jgi:hypothetical protein
MFGACAFDSTDIPSDETANFRHADPQTVKKSGCQKKEATVSTGASSLPVGEGCPRYRGIAAGSILVAGCVG